MDRRSVLRAAASLVGVIGAAFAAIPFLNSLLPSAKAKALAGPVEVDLSAMRPGEVKAYSYRGATVLVLRRTEEMIDALTSMQDHAFDSGDATDPAYAANASRSIRPDFLVISGICTHLGCVPRLRTADEGRGAFGEWWTGGFVCPCHSSAFDYAGRVVRGPAPTNLPVPPHRYASPTRIVIGEEATLS